MRYTAALVLFFLLVPFAFADIGPSPSYSFSVSNAEEYPEYDFYYAGNIWSLTKTFTAKEQKNSLKA